MTITIIDPEIAKSHELDANREIVVDMGGFRSTQGLLGVMIRLHISYMILSLIESGTNFYLITREDSFRLIGVLESNVLSKAQNFPDIGYRRAYEVGGKMIIREIYMGF